MGKSVNAPVNVLIIGYGNSLRRDDGAGLLLAEALFARRHAAGLPVDLITAHQLAPEMAVDIAESRAGVVLFVDTVVTPPSPPDEGETERGFRTAQLVPIDPLAASATLGHHLNPATLLLYAAQLYAAHPAAWLLQTPGYDLNHGEGLSALAQAAVDDALAGAETLWAKLHIAPEL